MNLEAHEPDRVEEVLQRHGAHAVTLTDAGDDPVLEPAPGCTPLWRDTRITALFSADVDFASLRADLGAALAVAELPANRVEPLADRVWEREWLKDFHPMRFGRRLWVAPDDGFAAPDDAVVVRLDPGLAFGTGTHATTALCLEWLDGVDVSGRSVLDVGCGSGILSIAALKLGARSVTGVDIDPQALLATRQNAERNAVGGPLTTAAELPPPAEPFDIVVANILASTLTDMAGLLCRSLKTGGSLALSGILDDQVTAVAAAYREFVEFETPAGKDGWALLHGTRT